MSREVLVDNENDENGIGPEGDVWSEEMIKEKIEDRNKKIEEEKGMSKKQQRNQRLARWKEEKKKNKIIEKGERRLKQVRKKEG